MDFITGAEKVVMSDVSLHMLPRDELVSCVFLVLAALVGLIGNGLMVRALVHYPQLRTGIFMLLGSIAVADMLSLTVVVPNTIVFFTLSSVNNAWCKGSKYLDAGTGFVAAYHLVVLTALRGVLLTSRGHHTRSTAHMMAIYLAIWFVALASAIPFLNTMEEHDKICVHSGAHNIEMDIWLLHSFSCFVPIAIITLIYVFVYLASKRYFRDSYSYHERHTSRIVNMVVILFVVCQIPFRAMDLHMYYVEMKADDLDINVPENSVINLYTARNYFLCIMMAEKAIRPIIYSKLSSKLDQAFEEVVNCTICQGPQAHERIPHGANIESASSGSQTNSITVSHSAANSRLSIENNIDKDLIGVLGNEFYDDVEGKVCIKMLSSSNVVDCESDNCEIFDQKKELVVLCEQINEIA